MSDDRIELVAVFSKSTAAHLYERMLSTDQRLEGVEDGVRLKATVPNSSELQWWLLGFGDQVEVFEPRSLREELQSTISAMSEKYRREESTTRPAQLLQERP